MQAHQGTRRRRLTVFGAREPRLRPLGPAAAARVDVLRARVDVDRIRADVTALAEPRDRRFAPQAMERAERHVTRRLREAGWPVRRRPFLAVDARGRGPYHGVNLVADRGGVRAHSNLLGAHLDTVAGSPGADDNASGVACLLEVARLLAGTTGVVLAVFDQEEVGLVGSTVLASELAVEGDLAAAVILESIGCTRREPGSQRMPPGLGLVYRRQAGRLRRNAFRGDFTLAVYRRSSQALALTFGEAVRTLAGPDATMLIRDPVDLPVLGPALRRLVPWITDFARSDHKPFWDLGVPAIQVTDTANFRNPHYHRATDLPDTLDYQRIADVAVAVALTLDPPGSDAREPGN